jgi:hypothetical protein
MIKDPGKSKLKEHVSTLQEKVTRLEKRVQKQAEKMAGYDGKIADQENRTAIIVEALDAPPVVLLRPPTHAVKHDFHAPLRYRCWCMTQNFTP